MSSEMFYPSGDDIDRMIELAIQCGIDNRGTSWPLELCRVRAKLRALLARTEARADGDDLAKRLEHAADYEGESGGWDETIALLRKAANRVRTHPQDASGDAAKLGAFAASILNLDEDWIGDVDGGTLQDAAEKYGLLQAVEVTEACGEGCNCAGYGDFPQTCYRPTDTMKRAMQAKEAK